MPKKSNLTPEERKAARRAKKAEKKRLAELKKQQHQYEHLGRELKYGDMVIRKHEKSWREMLMNIALPRMRIELEYAWHNFERTIDAKDFTISLLMDELKDAEEQYMMNMRSHMANIDKLIVLCNDQINGLKNDSKEVILQLYNAANVERTDIFNITKENEEYLKTMLYMLENQKKESEKLIRGEYLSKQEVEIGKLNDIASKFTEELQEKFNVVSNDTCNFLQGHINECASRKKEYFKLKELDEKMQLVTKKLWDKIYQDLDLIKTLKDNLSDREIVQNRRIKELTDERSHFESVFKVVKNHLEFERVSDIKNLTYLTLESNTAIKFLEDIEIKGEKLLKLSAVCRKFETQEEKTLSFPTFSEPLNHSLPSDLKDVRFRKELNLFWNRVAQVDASRYKMNEECNYLRIENNVLKQRIHEYCQCLNCEAFLPHVDFAASSTTL